MLSPSLYSRELIVIHDELHYEVSRVLERPIILLHNTTGQPIASIHYFVPEATETMMLPERNVDYAKFQAITSDPLSEGMQHGLLVTNMCFDDYIGWEVEDQTDEPLVIPPGKTFKWNMRSHTDTLKCRVSSMFGTPFQDAIWTRKQLICRPRIPVSPTDNLPTMLDHPAVMGGDGGLLRGVQEHMDDEDAYFASGCKWITITPTIAPDMLYTPNMSKAHTLKKALSLVEECIVNKNQRLLQRCKEIYNSEECVICLDGAPDATITPCGHKCCHADCLDGMYDKICPICRQPFMTRVLS